MPSRTKPVAVQVAAPAVVVIDRPAGTATTRAAVIRASRYPIVRIFSIYPLSGSRKRQINEDLIEGLRSGPLKGPILGRFRQVDGAFYLIAEVPTQWHAEPARKLGDAVGQERRRWGGRLPRLEPL